MDFKKYTWIILLILVIAGIIVLSFRYRTEILGASNHIKGANNASLFADEQKLLNANERNSIHNEEQSAPFVSERVSDRNPPPPYGWTLQTMPNMGSRRIRDFMFVDSLTGFAVASPNSYTDSAHILKTTNAGNNWVIKATYGGRLKKVTFLNSLTGYAGGNKFLKTTNAGENWTIWHWTVGRIMEDMFVMSEDTIWYGDTEPIYGGVFRTTNGGINWEKRDSGIPANSYPDRMYFYNSRIGFVYHAGFANGYKTTNAGLNWFQINGTFSKMCFSDSLNGFKASEGFYRTTNGGLNWTMDTLPDVIDLYTDKRVTDFFRVNRDTIYAVHGYVWYSENFAYRGVIFKTTNGGLNWGYQLPDTSFGVVWYDYVYAINNNVWAYANNGNAGIHSTTGGDITIYTGVKNISTETPPGFTLEQNYPNPFNQSTVIRFQLSVAGNASLKIFDMLGREVATLVNETLQPGVYLTTFDAEGLASGVYFYILQIKSSNGETQKVFSRTMLLLK
jgi:hypothetical protein